MLYRETVSPELLELLDELMQIDELSKLRLVRGTSLALQIGHRNSIDIDLFGEMKADKLRLTQVLQKFPSLESLGGSTSINVFRINGVKVDIVNYPYNWIEKPVIVDGYTMASLKDIAAMKVAAITQRGSKKDFIDLFFLLQEFALSEILGFYLEKIIDGNLWMAVRSMTYFEDADKQPMPAMFSNNTWEEMKAQVKISVFDYQKSI